MPGGYCKMGTVVMLKDVMIAVHSACVSGLQ